MAFHLITRHSHDVICEGAQPPEIRRVPLERLVLTIKALGYELPAAAVCARLLEPPAAAAVKQAVAALAGMDALDLSGGKEDLTALGSHLVRATPRRVVGDCSRGPSLRGVLEARLGAALRLSLGCARGSRASPPTRGSASSSCSAPSSVSSTKR